MKGKYSFTVSSRKLEYHFEIQRNITVIKGNSGTGKTTLLNMLYEYSIRGRQSGFKVQTSADYYVYLSDMPQISWEERLGKLKNTIIFIEENNGFVFSKQFAEYVRTSGNYFVIVARRPLKALAYSTNEIYEIKCEDGQSDLTKKYHYFENIYRNDVHIGNGIDIVITEDSNSGKEFFEKVFESKSVYSADGNSNVEKAIREIKDQNTVAIVDGAAFGAFIEECVNVANIKKHVVYIWTPESFEYLLLRAGVVKVPDLEEVMERTYDFIDSAEYLSWERYYTSLIEMNTRNTVLQYQKKKLNERYLVPAVLKKVIDIFPAELIKLI